jgi:SynChlorMet cassette protein ScmC
LFLIKQKKLENGYSLKLANGQGWYIIATERLKKWIEKFATILQLKTNESKGYPTLFLLEGESNQHISIEPIFELEHNMLKNLPRDGWSFCDFKLLCVWLHRDVPDIICEIKGELNHEMDIIRMWYALHPIYQRCQESGGLPLHAALVERDGEGILLAGRGGAGKSTCCWRLPSPWRVLCDDEALIVRDNQKQYFVHPFPTWSDYLWERSRHTWDVQQYLPLSGTFFLKQGEMNEAIPLGQGEAATLITQSAIQVCQRNWRNSDRKEESVQRRKLFENASELARAVPAFRLRVSLNGQFWEKIEAVLR